jgi:uncharacterized protein YdhG (YjbR/CyaY superfamily)
MQSKASSIPVYVKNLRAADRAVISGLDEMIRSEVPRAVGSMKYGMPTYEVGDRMIACNAQKNYFSFYADPLIVKTYLSELSSLSVGKSCIRFRKLDSELLSTLRKIVRAHKNA